MPRHHEMPPTPHKNPSIPPEKMELLRTLPIFREMVLNHVKGAARDMKEARNPAGAMVDELIKLTISDPDLRIGEVKNISW